MLLRFFVAGLLLAGAYPSYASDRCPPGNLLARVAPSAAARIIYPQRLTDGVVVAEGYRWDNKQSALVISGPGPQFDLGQPTRIRALLIQGDHPGRYQFSGSLDGTHWFGLWQTAPAEGRGMRLRHTAGSEP